MLALTVQNPTNWIKKRSSSSPELCGCNVTPCVYCVLRLLFWVKSAVDGHQCCKVSLLVSQKHWPSVWPPRRKILSLIVSGAEIWTQMTPREGNKGFWVKLAQFAKINLCNCMIWNSMLFIYFIQQGLCTSVIEIFWISIFMLLSVKAVRINLTGLKIKVKF